ncbi:MAG TPA: T9SS type A sorting domain-containing protein [Bacteroidales bacterium]|nr:T9SS type A sorting domain-containing protein [Bacteroidales bacterium]
MKKIIQIITVLIVFVLNVHSQQLVEKDKTWSIAQFDDKNGLDTCYYLKIGDDTLINDRTYSKVLISGDSLMTNWLEYDKYLCQDQNVVYCYSKSVQNEYVLYNFNLSIGDSIKVEGNGFYIYLDSIKTKNTKKYFYFSRNGEITTWVEGVGCLDDLFQNSGNINIVGGYSTLLCCKIGNDVLYHNVKYNNCFLTTSIKRSVDEAIVFQNYPNPFNDKTYININNYYNTKAFLCIYNVSGVLCKKIEVRQYGANNICIENLAKGVYFYNFTIDGKYKSQLKRMICY